jgi:hypothetical protein
MTESRLQLALQGATVALLLVVALLLSGLGSKLDNVTDAVSAVDSHVQDVGISVDSLQGCFMPKGGFNAAITAGACRP